MSRTVGKFARWVALGSTGLLIQDKFHGLSLGDWAMLAWVVLGLSLIAVLMTEEQLRAYRPTLRLERSERSTVLRLTKPEKRPLWIRAKRCKKQEVEIGQRAIEVGGRVLNAAGVAQQKTGGLALRMGHDDGSLEAYQAAYHQALHEIKATVGAEWAEILQSLDELGERPGMVYEISVNFTGLDEDAMKVQAAGRKILRRHGVEPPQSSSATISSSDQM